MSRRHPIGAAGAVTALMVDGYDGTIDVSATGVRTQSVSAANASACQHPVAEIVKERIYRFEGASNPEDSSIVIGLRCRLCGDTGIVVSAYGHAADPKLFAILNQMVTSRTSPDPVR